MHGTYENTKSSHASSPERILEGSTVLVSLHVKGPSALTSYQFSRTIRHVLRPSRLLLLHLTTDS
jgi:hypothetical protein